MEKLPVGDEPAGRCDLVDGGQFIAQETSQHLPSGSAAVDVNSFLGVLECFLEFCQVVLFDVFDIGIAKGDIDPFGDLTGKGYGANVRVHTDGSPGYGDPFFLVDEGEFDPVFEDIAGNIAAEVMIIDIQDRLAVDFVDGRTLSFGHLHQLADALPVEEVLGFDFQGIGIDGGHDDVGVILIHRKDLAPLKTEVIPRISSCQNDIRKSFVQAAQQCGRIEAEGVGKNDQQFGLVGDHAVRQRGEHGINISAVSPGTGDGVIKKREGDDDRIVPHASLGDDARRRRRDQAGFGEQVLKFVPDGMGFFGCPVGEKELDQNRRVVSNSMGFYKLSE